VELKVNKLDSVDTQMPYDFYSLPFCQPATITQNAENLGEILAGDKIESSPYVINMRQMVGCKILCRKQLDAKEQNNFAEKVKENYHINWIVDNMPAAQSYALVETSTGNKEGNIYQKGYPVGFIGGPDYAGTQAGTPYLNNHIRIMLHYHEEPSSYEGFRIVSFLVEPFSLKHKYEGEFAGEATSMTNCNSLNPVRSSESPQPLEGQGADDIIFTYDVTWQASDVKWASRWDIYLKMFTGSGNRVHWFAITNSTIIVFALSAVVAVTLGRALRADLAVYNAISDEEDPQEETGWKLIHGDVFRPPPHAAWLSVLLGTGAQLFAMCFILLVFACFGFLSPANRGALGTALLVVFVLLGVLAGYVGTRAYKNFGLTEWKKNTVKIALLFPGTVFASFFFLDLLIWGQGSTGAVPFGTLVALLVLWLGISAPLVYLGSYFAFKKPVTEQPVVVNAIPRMIPGTYDRCTHFLFIALSGTLPFSAIYIEIFYVMSSVWNHQFYYVFGFLGLVYLILIVTCAEISIIMAYQCIIKEDYRWWWVSFFASGSTGLYMFLFAVYYFYTNMHVVKFLSAAIYFGYMLLASLGMFMLCGFVGMTATYFFMRRIYFSVKID